MYNEYKQFVTDDLFWKPFGTHGVGHTRRVLYLALLLADKKNLTEQEKKILALACCYHDIGRWHDEEDDEHGMDSSNKFLDRGLDKKHNLNPEEVEIILNLIVCHSLDDQQFFGEDRELLMYQILKDADALDRLRFNDLNTKYLRLPESHAMIELEFSLLRADGVIKS
jgi:HD superfamily phosphodiesterase